MKALFNEVCGRCGKFSPRCADVFLRVTGKATQYHGTPTTLCELCRKVNRGKFRVDDKHK